MARADPALSWECIQMPLVFEWDAEKGKNNHRKHRVSFDEACTVFDDPLAFIFLDEDHSQRETREIIIGHSIVRRLMIVCFTVRSNDRIRIISARPATRRERSDYENYLQK
jgi:uncharacterized DUF497 family protein